jgi:hypothetical protein
MAVSTSNQSARIDLPTVCAIAVVVYLTGTVTHEAFGHGLVSVIFGAHILHVSSVDMAPVGGNLTPWESRAVSAAGTLANIALGVIALILLRRTRSQSANTQYFLWLLGHLNLFIGGGYMMALSFAPFGDWHDFTQGLNSPFAWKLGLTIAGVIVSVAALVHAGATLARFTGDEAPARSRRAVTLTIAPYLVGGTVETIAALFNPVGWQLIFISAIAASFGGTFCLVWTPFWMRPLSGEEALRAAPLLPSRSLPWLTAGVIALLFLVFGLGPGLPRH